MAPRKEPTRLKVEQKQYHVFDPADVKKSLLDITLTSLLVDPLTASRNLSLERNPPLVILP